MPTLPRSRLVAMARAQATEMHCDVVRDETELDGSHVLGLERLHPAARGTTGSKRATLDVAGATLRIDERGPRVEVSLDADWRVREFRFLKLTSPVLTRERGEGLRTNDPAFRTAWNVRGSDFAFRFFLSLTSALDVLRDHACELTFEDARLTAKLFIDGKPPLRDIVAALIVIWREARPVKGRGAGAVSRPHSPRKPRKPRVLASARAVEKLTKAFREATAPYGGHVERVRDTLEARVSLAGHLSDDLQGELVAGFSTLRSRVHGVGVRATFAMPATRYQLSLSPQRGVRGFFASLGDDRVGDVELDRAFVIQLGTAAPELVRALKEPLLACSPCRASVHWTRERLVLQLEDVRTARAGIIGDVSAALQLWRHAARWAAGLID